MKKDFEITDRKTIYEILDNIEYGTLAVSDGGVPYAVPVNFVYLDDEVYWHGALRNKKMQIIQNNPNVSFSVVKRYALIPSTFSSNDGLACPATQFFASVNIDGVAELVKSRADKAMMFEAMMAKLQPKGGYKSFDDEAYDKALKATAVVKIVSNTMNTKVKFGQHLSQDRFDMIIENLQRRGESLDLETVNMMKKFR